MGRQGRGRGKKSEMGGRGRSMGGGGGGMGRGMIKRLIAEDLGKEGMSERRREGTAT